MALCLLLGGCATSVPKEKLRDIFTLVRDKKFDEAEKKFEDTTSSSLIGQYSTYSGQKIPAVNSPNHDDVSTLISSSKDYITGCQEKVVKIQKLSPLKTDDDESNFNENFRTLQEDFTNHCRDNVKENWSSISKIKEYSTVDLFPIFKMSEEEFQKQVNRINTEIDQIENKSSMNQAEAKMKQDLYESSPEYYSKKLCEMNNIVIKANSILDKEKEAAKVSGYVDKRRMYEAGQAVTANQRKIQHFSTEYKNKFGKIWSSSYCK